MFLSQRSYFSVVLLCGFFAGSCKTVQESPSIERSVTGEIFLENLDKVSNCNSGESKVKYSLVADTGQKLKLTDVLNPSSVLNPTAIKNTELSPGFIGRRYNGIRFDFCVSNDTAEVRLDNIIASTSEGGLGRLLFTAIAPDAPRKYDVNLQELLGALDSENADYSKIDIAMDRVESPKLTFRVKGFKTSSGVSGLAIFSGTKKANKFVPKDCTGDKFCMWGKLVDYDAFAPVLPVNNSRDYSVGRIHLKVFYEMAGAQGNYAAYFFKGLELKDGNVTPAIKMTASEIDVANKLSAIYTHHGLMDHFMLSLDGVTYDIGALDPVTKSLGIKVTRKGKDTFVSFNPTCTKITACGKPIDLPQSGGRGLPRPQ
jgi:hypothetical protein